MTRDAHGETEPVSTMWRAVIWWVGVVLLAAWPGWAAADGLDDPYGDRGAYLRVAPTGGTVGALFPVGPVSVWAAGSVDARLLGTSLEGGLRYRAVEGPRYALDFWTELGPQIWFRGPVAAGADLEVGVRNLFGHKLIRGSVGGVLDTAATLVPTTDVRVRPEGTAGIGVVGATGPILPDGAWVRGALGYDFRFGSLGAVHADVGLTLRWAWGDGDR